MKYPLIAALLLSTTVSAQDFMCEGEELVLLPGDVIQSLTSRLGHNNMGFIATFEGTQVEWRVHEDRGARRMYECRWFNNDATCQKVEVGYGYGPHSIAFYDLKDGSARAETFSHRSGGSWFTRHTCTEI